MDTLLKSFPLCSKFFGGRILIITPLLCVCVSVGIPDLITPEFLPTSLCTRTCMHVWSSRFLMYTPKASPSHTHHYKTDTLCIRINFRCVYLCMCVGVVSFSIALFPGHSIFQCYHCSATKNSDFVLIFRLFSVRIV